MMSGCVVYASCLISSCLLVMPLMLTCNMDMPVARGVLIGLCGVFLGVVASFLLFACVGVECCVGVAVWFRTYALAPAPACGLAEHTAVGPGFDSTSPTKSRFRLASHRTTCTLFTPDPAEYNSKLNLQINNTL